MFENLDRGYKVMALAIELFGKRRVQIHISLSQPVYQRLALKIFDLHGPFGEPGQ